MDILYYIKAPYYYFYFLYIKYYGTYDQRVNLERIYNEVDYKWEFCEEI